MVDFFKNFGFGNKGSEEMPVKPRPKEISESDEKQSGAEYSPETKPKSLKNLDPEKNKGDLPESQLANSKKTDPKRDEGDLPELELVEIQKSEKPISEIRGKKYNIEAIGPWNNYTLVILEEDDSIRVFDENMRLVDDFESPSNSKKVTVNWQDTVIKNMVKRSYISNHPEHAHNPSVLMFDNLPLELKPFAKKILSGRSGHFGLSAQSSTTISTSDMTILSDKYILFKDKETGASFAFKTKNDSGVVLAPRNWQRIEPKDKIPSDLIEEIKNISGEHEGFKKINQKYNAFITSVGINLMDVSDSQKKSLFSDKLPSIEKNITIDPKNPDVIYYCQSSNPRSIMKLDLKNEPDTWSPVMAELPNKYESIGNLQLDPSGNFFLFYSENNLVVISKDTLEEVKKIPNLTHVNFDSQGRIRAVDEEGHLVIYEPRFEKLIQEMDKRRVSRLASGIEIKDIFDSEVEKASEVKKDIIAIEHLITIRDKYKKQFEDILVKATTQKNIQNIRKGLNKLIEALRQNKLKPNEVEFVVEEIEILIKEKEKEFAIKETREVLSLVKTKLASSITISSIPDMRSELEKVKAVESLLEEDLRKEYREISQEFDQKSLEYYKNYEEEIIRDAKGHIEVIRKELESFTSKYQMDDWLELRLPYIDKRFGRQAAEIMEANRSNFSSSSKAYDATVEARRELRTMASSFEKKFKIEYAKIREQASVRIENNVNLLAQDMDGLIDRLQSKGFTSRETAEQYLSGSEARKILEEEILGLEKDNPDLAKELMRGMKVRISNALGAIERGAITQVAKTGQQMVPFGETFFPKWEAKVREKEDRKVDLIFENDPGTHGENIFGDVCVSIHTATGKIEKVRLYEGWEDENAWRFGQISRFGKSIPPSYIRATQYGVIKNGYRDWSRGEKSNLRQELKNKRKDLTETYKKLKEQYKAQGKSLKEIKNDPEFVKKIENYSNFCSENNIVILRRIDEIKNEPDIEYTNGKGFVPDWGDHWVKDPQTDKYLEEMAKRFKMQLDLQEGMLNLKGHAGTGKDVLLKMFASKDYANRAYFPTDCSRWTTEFELSQDVSLGVENGASVTIRDDSAVLRGIQTPGSIVYFNEFNAMPEQAQMFLHALTDEKRSLTLKTSSGRVVKAAKDVLLVCSMNPGYRGTTEPQSATKRRMVSLEIDYPPLIRKPDAGDTHPNPPYDASEALRIARGVDSLDDLTIEANLEHNEFVKLWDSYINGIESGAPEPTTTQKFDLDVILALVQFSNILRENFIKFTSKSGSRDRNVLPIIHPISGSELRRCAYWLSKMSPEEKVTANNDEVARELIDEWFLSNIDVKEDREIIRKAMVNWTSRKRLKA